MPEDDSMKAMLFQGPQLIPAKVSILPAAWVRYREDLEAIVRRHPDLFGKPKEGVRDYNAMNPFFKAGNHIDAWGCVWTTLLEGLHPVVTGHPVPTREAVRRLEPPVADEGLPHGFLFLRLTYLRGWEEAMLDFAEEPPELQRLLDVVLEYNLRQLRLQLAKMDRPTVFGFGDDLGMQETLPISPATWRKYLKPCYARIYGECRAAGHWVYMHTDGHILPIVPDLIECGVSVLNPQVGANGLEGLARTCKGKVCIDIDPDRQMLPFWTPDRIDEHIRQIVETLGSPEGGLWIKAEVGPDVPLANIEALCEAIEKHRRRFARRA